MTRKPTSYAQLLAETKERHEVAVRRLQIDPEDIRTQKEVERLAADVRTLERYAAQERNK